MSPQCGILGICLFPDADGNPWGSAVETQDSAIQWQGPNGEVRWTWSSWGRLPLADCAQHAFPGDYAHINSLQWTGQGVLALLPRLFQHRHDRS